MKKKGQKFIPDTGANAATFVGILIVIILFYILFLPQDERNKLLQETTTPGLIITEGNNLTLLDEDVGRIDFRNLDRFNHSIPSFTLYRTTNAEALKKINPFYIRNGWFDKKPFNTSFALADPAHTTNVLLSFTANRHKGMLTITMNDNIIFEAELSGENVEPIVVPQELLQNTNKLEFEVSKVGWQFWTTNEYAFQNMEIIGDITDISKQESKNVFYATESEVLNIERATLKYSPECDPDTAGVLEISINGKNVFSGVPDCGIMNRIEFNPGIIDIGGNKVVFKTGEGSYLVDLIMVNTELKAKTFPVFYFDVNESVFRNISSGNVSAFVKIRFVDDSESKQFDLSVNGHLTRVDQKKSFFEKRVSSWIEDGNNYIEIRPKSVLNIVNLRVELFEED
jgi:hypothetical protein